MTTILDVKDLTIQFGGLIAVDNLSFTMKEGEITSLIGPNGAGKTTVINLLTGFYHPNNGQVLLENKDTVGLTTDEFVERGFCRTFQNIRLFPSMTVEENILIGMQHRIDYDAFYSLFPNSRKNTWEKRAREEAGRIIDKIGLSEFRYSKSTSLPYGKQRKLEIGRALASKPKILLLDEPAAGMNPAEKQELSKFIKSLLVEVKAILLIEHDMKLVMDISDKIVVINHGKKICEGRPEAVRTNKDVIEAYLGKKGVKDAIRG